ncbi:magnetosome protein mamI-3 [Fundidesulfovibrio magnetotacticus]|uniref:Magnetosome protein mamI-3 n=1 Tax=Fundidesulfovibrio magnetotacticus TaxID=2730080 RepID=A0A6V8LR99_9BACT|nr:magnetosome protein mamI-3 [Fundidesulfovibrio magnetotacticus]
MVFFVLHKSTSKPQSPQAMVAAAVSDWFSPAPREWQPGMGPQPLIYHPAAQQQLVWEPLPGSPQAQKPKFETGWRALPGQQPAAPNVPGTPGTPGNGIRAYTGPVQ